MYNFCTLFDSYYLDKALAMYRSLLNVCDDFHLYVFCFDDVAFNVLSKMNLSHMDIIHHTKIETEKLLELKKERSKAEFCWTCTPVIIDYVLDNYDVENCTYIDADVYFFYSPKVLFDEIKEAEANVVITPHRFLDTSEDQYFQNRSGKYCVEFNYFDRSSNSREALTWWRTKCEEWCFHLYEPDRMGDQKYLEKFPELFKGVHELEYVGGGVAPWNLKQYVFKQRENGKLIFEDLKSGNDFVVVFYHFQNLRYLNHRYVNICSETHSKITKDSIYIPYLKEIESVRKELEKYDISFSLKKKYSSNPIIAFLQGTILRFKIKSISDIYNLDRIREEVNDIL